MNVLAGIEETNDAGATETEVSRKWQFDQEIVHLNTNIYHKLNIDS